MPREVTTAASDNAGYAVSFGAQLDGGVNEIPEAFVFVYPPKEK